MYPCETAHPVRTSARPGIFPIHPALLDTSDLTRLQKLPNDQITRATLIYLYVHVYVFSGNNPRG